MPIQRLFVIAPSVARLIRKKRGGEHVIAGYFPDQAQHSTFVQIEEARSSLILEAGPERCPRRRSSLAGRQKQMEFDLVATASEQVEDVQARAQVSTQAVSQTDTVFGDSEDALRAHDIQPLRTEGVKAKSRKHLRASKAAEKETVSGPDREAEMTELSMASSQAPQRRLTKRLAAAAQLPRHERWKGRLHPAGW